ncbi:MAG: hypothetical protein Q7J32_02650, partial [Sphingomonadaceae bacterium]|nr:hypothetical protein [Sphingomonadaceae bacterium]
MMIRKAALLAATAATAATLLPALASAQEVRDSPGQTAQAGAADTDTGIEEIIVTARKTEELRSDAPISVSAL